MGFKKVNQDDLKINASTNFLGMPIREVGKLVQTKKREKVIDSNALGSLSEILVLNEEFLEYHHNYDGSRKNLAGYGNIVIFNNSLKDRIWDSYLKFSGTQFEKQDSEKGMNLGIFDPNSNKILKYEIVNSEILPDLVIVNEQIENLSQEINIVGSNTNEEASHINNNHKNYVLLLGSENKVKFRIFIENISSSVLENIKLKKYFSNQFYDIEFSGSLGKDFEITSNYVECPIKNLNPGEKTEIILLANIFPKRKEDIRTGRIELSLNLKNYTISEVEIENFSAYSHAMHAINKTEKEHAPNHWQCSLIFENHSDFKMKLNSVLILDKSRKDTYLNLNFGDTPRIIVPGETYKTDEFDFVDEKEPTFSRKVEYSVDYNVEKNSMITVQYEDSIFKVVNIILKKKMLEQEIKSFEETEVDTEFVVKNQGTLPVKGIKAQERIPADFLPPRDIEAFKILNSSGNIEIEDIEIKITPDDEDPTHQHLLELNLNLKNNHAITLIEVDDFIEIKHPLKAVTPDYQKEYEFPIKVTSYYMKYNHSENDEFYVTKNQLDKMVETQIKISHKRRKLMIGKEIFPGRDSSEFAIFITAKNGSNIKLNDVNITDAFPYTFELISSNIDHELSKADKSGEHKITFNLDTILPYQEREIMYYLKNITGKEIKYSDLESFFIG